MKDFLKNKLEINDNVVFITQGYRDFSKGVILRFTKQFCIIKKDGEKGVFSEIKQKPEQLIKV